VGTRLVLLVERTAHELGLTPPSSIESTTDETQLRWKNLLLGLHRDIRARMRFTQQKATVTIPLQTDRVNYPLPLDFYALLPDTVWDDTSDIPLGSPVSDRVWTYITKRGLGIQGGYIYRLFGVDYVSQQNTTSPVDTGTGQLQVYPTPTDGTGQLTMDYISTRLFAYPAWSPSTAYTAGNTVSISGGDLACTVSGTSGTTPPTPPSFTYEDYEETVTDGTVTWKTNPIVSITITDDDQRSIFDDEVLVNGLKFYYCRAQGLPFESYEREYERCIARSSTRYKGSYRGSLEGGCHGGRRYGPSTPGGWSFS
jgi:hypothetical protein